MGKVIDFKTAGLEREFEKFINMTLENKQDILFNGWKMKEPLNLVKLIKRNEVEVVSRESSNKFKVKYSEKYYDYVSLDTISSI